MMDPFSQGLVGAALPQALGLKKNLRAFTLIGFLSGLTPDLDILIRSSTDSLLAIE
jgi:inner membrane protein